MDINTKAKSNVLQQLIEMMDEKMLGDLKSKSPKFAKVDIQSDDPALANSLKDKLVDGIKEDKAEGEDPMAEQDHEDPADMERLLEMYRKLK